MKLTVALLLVSLALCCYSATADPCPSLSNVLNKYLFGSLPEYLQSIAPFVTRDVMNAAAYELKGCVLNLSKEHSEAIEELMKNILASC